MKTNPFTFTNVMGAVMSSSIATLARVLEQKIIDVPEDETKLIKDSMASLREKMMALDLNLKNNSYTIDINQNEMSMIGLALIMVLKAIQNHNAEDFFGRDIMAANEISIQFEKMDWTEDKETSNED